MLKKKWRNIYLQKSLDLLTIDKWQRANYQWLRIETISNSKQITLFLIPFPGNRFNTSVKASLAWKIQINSIFFGNKNMRTKIKIVE